MRTPPFAGEPRTAIILPSSNHAISPDTSARTVRSNADSVSTQEEDVLLVRLDFRNFDGGLRLHAPQIPVGSEAVRAAGGESVTLDPTATTGQTVQIQETRENQINSTRDMLASRALLERVVERIGADAILNGGKQAAQKTESAAAPRIESKLAASLAMLATTALSPNVSPEEKAVAKLSKSIAIKVGRNTSVIDISSEAADAPLAQRILKEFIEAYQQLHLSANRTAGSLEFFTTQTARLKEQLDVAVASLRDAKNESGIVSLPDEQRALQDELVGLETTTVDTQVALAASNAAIGAIRKSFGETPEHMPTQHTTGYPNVAADGLQQEYYKLRLSLEELQTRLGPEHPKVVEASKQLQHATAMLDATELERTQSTISLHPSRQALDLELRHEETQNASLRAKADALKEQLAALEQRTRELNGREVRIADLERQVTIAETSYRSYMEHLEEARIGDALEFNRISNVNVVQPPSLVRSPVSPKASLILGGGLLVALCGAVCLALGSEYLDNSLKTPEDVETELGLPVLASVERVTKRNGFAHSAH